MDEPFKGLFTQGMVTHVTYKNKEGEWIEPKDIINDKGVLKDKNNIKVETGKIEKMSKSKKNVVDPNDIISSYGADTARWFMLSDSPPERDLQWTDTGIAASFKFINKLFEFIEKFKNFNSKDINNAELVEKLKEIINQVSENIEAFQFNKAVAKIYEFVNNLNDALSNNKLSYEDFSWSLRKLAIILQPFVPHISEEIWSSLGSSTLCVNEVWKKEIVKRKEKLKIAIQINGKTKQIIEIDEGLSKEMVLNRVKDNEKIKKNLFGKNIKREIYVPGKIVNLVI